MHPKMFLPDVCVPRLKSDFRTLMVTQAIPATWSFRHATGRVPPHMASLFALRDKAVTSPGAGRREKCRSSSPCRGQQVGWGKNQDP